MKKTIMKKIVLLVVTLLLMSVVSACGEEVSLTLGETTTVEQQAEFTADNIIISPKVFPPISGDNPMGWVMDDESKTYVTIITTIKNLSSEALTIEDLWVNFGVILDGEYTDGTIVAVETEYGTKLDDSKPVAAGETETVYYITEVAKADLSKLTAAEFDFGKTTLALNVDTSKKVALAEPLNMDESYRIKGLGTVTPKSIKFMEELEPSNPGYSYDYYAPQTADDQLLVLRTKTENTSKKKKAAYRYLNMMVYVDETVYLGDVVADDAHAANITGSETLSAGEERNVYGMVNLPKSVKKADCEIYVYLNGKYYRCEMK